MSYFELFLKSDSKRKRTGTTHMNGSKKVAIASFVVGLLVSSAAILLSNPENRKAVGEFTKNARTTVTKLREKK